MKQQKKRITLMVVPSNGSEIRSIAMSVPVIVFGCLLLAGIVFSSAFFPYKYFSARAHAQQEATAALAEENRYAQLSESVKQAAAAGGAFSKELDKTVDILSNRAAGGFVGANAFEASYAARASQFDAVTPLLTIADRLNKNIPIFRDINTSLSKQSELMRRLPVYWPVPGGVVSMEWGPNMHPVYGSWYLHKGIDLAASPGTPVYSMADGIVTEAGFDVDFGLNVYVSHDYGFVTRYSHLSSVLVKKGQLVGQGQRVGLVGSTGLVTGSALDLQLYLGDDLMDPGVYLRLINAGAYTRPLNNR